jgi:hypothetical protein
MDKLLVILPQLNVIQRWNLTTFEREVTAMLPLKSTVQTACMGSASSGPLLLYTGRDNRGGGDQLHFLDIQRLKPIEVGWATQRLDLGYDQMHIRASADGKVFGLWSTAVSPQGLRSLVLVGNAARTYSQHTTVFHIVPGPDGKVLYTGMGLYTNETKSLGAGSPDQRAYLPAHQGNYYLSFDTTGKGSSASVHMTGESRSLATLANLEVALGTRREEPSKDPLAPDKRIHFLPSAKLLVTIPASKDQLVLRRFDVEEALDKSGVNYLFVASQPPTTARKGTVFSYQLVVRSKEKGLTYRVESGPEGLRVSPTGRVTWNVAADYAEAETDVILVVRNARGQECFHTFRLAVRE